MKGQTKRQSSDGIAEITRRQGGRGHQLEQPPAQAHSSRHGPRHVRWHVVAQRRARNRLARRTRQAQRR